MKLNVQFVNFPKSDLIRDLVSERIKDCFEKFSTQAISIRAFFTMDGIEHHVKIAVKASRLNACVNASATNAGVSIEKAIQKLESFLRRSSGKEKQRKTSFLPMTENIEMSHNGKRNPYQQENVFDKYETSYRKDFEYM